MLATRPLFASCQKDTTKPTCPKLQTRKLTGQWPDGGDGLAGIRHMRGGEVAKYLEHCLDVGKTLVQTFAEMKLPRRSNCSSDLLLAAASFGRGSSR